MLLKHMRPKLLAMIAICTLILSLLACNGTRKAVPTLAVTAFVAADNASIEEPPAATPSVAPVVLDIDRLQSEMDTELAGFDYQQQRLIVTGIEMRNRQLIVHLRREGPPLMEDYFGQLGLIHGVIVRNMPDIDSVRTIDVEAQNGFVVQMDDLLDFYDGLLEFDEFRSRWRFFE